MPTPYAEVAPPRALRPFLQRLWVQRIDGPPPPDGRRLLPDGRMDLVWIGGIGVRISGPRTRFFRPPDLGHVLVFGASFHPGAAPSLLRTPARELLDAHVHLDDVDARLAARLDEAAGDASDEREALAAFARELGRALIDLPAPDHALRAAVAALGAPGATVAGAAARAHLSERALERRCAEHVGYTPKALQRVLRFQRFLRHLTSPRGADLALAAAQAGYADQAHATREVRRIAGITPRQLRVWQR